MAQSHDTSDSISSRALDFDRRSLLSAMASFIICSAASPSLAGIIGVSEYLMDRLCSIVFALYFQIFLCSVLCPPQERRWCRLKTRETSSVYLSLKVNKTHPPVILCSPIHVEGVQQALSGRSKCSRLSPNLHMLLTQFEFQQACNAVCRLGCSAGSSSW